MAINILPAILKANSTPFHSTLIPASLNEGVSTSVSFTLTNPPADSTNYQFVREDTTGAGGDCNAVFLYLLRFQCIGINEPASDRQQLFRRQYDSEGDSHER
ncbi:hypothetical protein [Leptospira stimsonii]|uniref:Ig-like domain-containing protein n=1 Tax=Leptospira stimsonii TaxID=2202203 RepID=A0ABY2MWV2_9LEPT|nr:hypothetical protein [Leptospira stimsonii]TGK23809.1 hypothetical protein EHO98_03870 [Leptospira stimsonii]TGM10483.1 hypothetical protein EHQ90_18650 [Leptospira stimsonii]